MSLRISRAFSLGGSRRIEGLFEAFNLTNHTNAVLFSGVLTSPFFGQAVAASAPRRLELGARLSF